MSQPAPATPAPKARIRLESVDLLRGLVIVVMALDHARDYFHFGALQGFSPTDLGHTTPALFFTRWITHFCAPVFSFLAGTGTWFSYSRGRPVGELQRFLVSRGLWLIFLELTLLRWFGWQFRIDLDSYKFGVLWSLGWSMLFLAAILRLPVRAIGWIGVVMIVVHNAFDRVVPQDWGGGAWLWEVLHEGGRIEAGHFEFFALYPLVPWLGVMAAGFAFGSLFGLDAAVRLRRLALLGWGMVAAFVVLRFSNLYGDSAHWAAQSSPLFTVLSFLNVTKYPPSLLYLLMTLGPACLLLRWFERGGTPALLRPILVVGRVPMFFYLLHIPLIHALAWIGFTLKYGRADFLFLGTQPAPAGAGVSLLALYGIWAVIVVALYPGCVWFADLKKRRRDLWWLSYF